MAYDRIQIVLFGVPRLHDICLTELFGVTGHVSPSGLPKGSVCKTAAIQVRWRWITSAAGVVILDEFARVGTRILRLSGPIGKAYGGRSGCQGARGLGPFEGVQQGGQLVAGLGLGRVPCVSGPAGKVDTGV